MPPVARITDLLLGHSQPSFSPSRAKFWARMYAVTQPSTLNVTDVAACDLSLHYRLVPGFRYVWPFSEETGRDCMVQSIHPSSRPWASIAFLLHSYPDMHGTHLQTVILAVFAKKQTRRCSKFLVAACTTASQNVVKGQWTNSKQTVRGTLFTVRLICMYAPHVVLV